MGKKIVAYQTDDGKVFSGKGAKERMEEHENRLKMKKRINDIKDEACHIYKFNEKFDPSGEKEEALVDDVCENYDLGFSDVVTVIIRLRAYNPEAFQRLMCYIERI